MDTSLLLNKFVKFKILVCYFLLWHLTLC